MIVPGRNWSRSESEKDKIDRQYPGAESPDKEANMEIKPFGKTRKGQETHAYTFKGPAGMEMTVSDFGATLLSLKVPDKNGRLVDVVLGYGSQEGYEGTSGTYFGATVGRNANRIGKASFALGGKTFALAKNDGENNLHSGPDGYSFRVWQVEKAAEHSITFLLESPDGDQGYPGALTMRVTYTLTDSQSVCIEYAGVSTADTVINMTNHSYFNLNGHDSGPITGHTLWVDADSFTATDDQLIPTGEILPVDGTPMDFRTAKAVGRDLNEPYQPLLFGRGYDHNWCLNNHGAFCKVAEIRGDKTGIAMEVMTDRPGIQIYSGNFLKDEPGKDGAVYQHRQGICFETQGYPDSGNHPNFPSSIYKAGQAYRSKTEYQFHVW